MQDPLRHLKDNQCHCSHDSHFKIERGKETYQHQTIADTSYHLYGSPRTDAVVSSLRDGVPNCATLVIGEHSIQFFPHSQDSVDNLQKALEELAQKLAPYVSQPGKEELREELLEVQSAYERNDSNI